ncbi:protein Flattop [Rhynchophorus ferrugineus]|uniref:Cilia- and flagella-associated protein 126 n=1 Tax=Rhynchophorus ferrugineus TaxID=354439 RepID=A0A834IU27_RHYFE|nr:hypothetical protein GWI33_002048 [Rhynchophorus ferrugineus]
MAKHYYAYQFDMPYHPTYLRNWEVPKYYCPKPRRRVGRTEIIANTRGHILPGVPKPKSNPFGDFIGTWHLPNKITRDIANKLNGSADKAAFLQKCAQIAAAVPSKYFEIQKKSEDVNEDQKEEVRTALSETESVTVERDHNICPIHGI